jgi:hypothetical protein
MAGVGTPHRLGERVAEGELGPTSSGVLRIKRLGRNTFRMSAWEPPLRWQWVGRLPGIRINYDHRFEASGPATTGWSGWSSSKHPSRRSSGASSPACTVPTSIEPFRTCRSGSASRRKAIG